MKALFVILTVISALSPLLTLSWLWQLKEWRRDRLLEHLRRDGIVKQLWGVARPVVVGLSVIALFVLRGDPLAIVTLMTALMLLSTMTVVQIALGKQRRPTFTKKAITITGTAGLLTLAGAIVAERTEWIVLLPFIVLLQPLTIVIAWLAWKPVDAFLKHRIIAHAAHMRRKFSDLTVIGVTGSVGKTTAKELLACVLDDLQPAVTPNHVNSEIGVARWISSRLAKKDARVFVVEMGAYKKGEIALLCSFVQPSMGVVTSVGTQHIALFGSQEALFQAKSELVLSLPQNGHAFLNGDSDLCRSMAKLSPCPRTIVGTGGQCDLEAFDIEETSYGIRFRVDSTIFDLSLHGTHNVSNVLLAIAVGQTLGISMERMRARLRSFSPLSQTFEVREEHGVRILDDTHNSSAASVKAAIAWAKVQPEAHKTLLAAGLIEMGEYQSPAEKELGLLASTVFERVVVIDAASARNFSAEGKCRVETLGPDTRRVPAGSLLVCSGRMPGTILSRLLPHP